MRTVHYIPTKRLVLYLGLFLVAACPVRAWSQTSQLKIQAVLVDKDLNLKPVPRLSIMLQPENGEPATLRTSLEGIVEAELEPGRYHLTTADPVEFQGKRYSWSLELVLDQPHQTVELSNDNATVEVLGGEAAPPTGRGPEMYRALRNAVVRVRAEGGDGSGFIVDAAGLVLTNYHVVENSHYFAVQYDEERKVAADLVAADSNKDIALLRVNLTAYPEAVVAKLLKAPPGEAGLREGDDLLAITSPRYGERLLTRGIVSHIEDDSIISDLSVSPGSSGGPVFGPNESVVGIATSRGAGVSKIIRIQEALPLIEEGRRKLEGTPGPEATLLPVEPTDFFPAEPLRAILGVEPFDVAKYTLNAGPFEISFRTPTVEYYFSTKDAVETARRQAKRSKRAFSQTDLPAEILKAAEEYKPVLVIVTFPKTGFWAGKAKADFLKMRLLCNGQETTPIDRGRVLLSTIGLGWGTGNLVRDPAYHGIYVYGPDDVAPSCKSMTVEVFSAKDPTQPILLSLEPLFVSEIWRQFEPYRKARETKSQ